MKSPIVHVYLENCHNSEVKFLEPPATATASYCSHLTKLQNLQILSIRHRAADNVSLHLDEFIFKLCLSFAACQYFLEQHRRELNGMVGKNLLMIPSHQLGIRLLHIPTSEVTRVF